MIVRGDLAISRVMLGAVKGGPCPGRCTPVLEGLKGSLSVRTSAMADMWVSVPVSALIAVYGCRYVAVVCMPDRRASAGT